MKPTHYSDKTIVMNEIRDDNKFIIPQFQRNVVWNKKKREAFLRNVLDGEPFGIILIREQDGKYELIDGLQRISTIKDFDENPYEYLNPSDINIEEVDNLIKAHLTSRGLPVDETFIEDNHEEWRAKIFDCLKGGLKEYQIMKRMQDSFELKNEDEINEIIFDICYNFKNSIKLDGLKVMAINYTGPIENIPNVFFFFFTGGVQLSKYETYAALWFKTKFKVDDDELVEIVKKKYTQLQRDSDMEVDFSETAINEDGITLFEYCYALGSIMRNEDDGFEILFGTNKKSTDPTGFELLALLLTDKVNKADQLYDLLKDVSPEFLVELKDTIKESLRQISEALKPLLIGMNQSNLHSDSYYLIYHIIVSYLKEYYDINPKTQTIIEKESDLKKRSFKKYAKHHYLHDCITDFWKNNRQVSDLEKEVIDEKRRQKYWYKIKSEDWDKAIQIFLDSQKSSGKSVSQKNKLFIDYLTKLKTMDKPQCKSYFLKKDEDNKPYPLDFEHIVPKKVIADHIKDLTYSQQRTYHVSAVGNLCYLTSLDNKAKKDKTLYEYIEDRPSFVEDKPYLKCISYPDEDKLDFITYSNDDFREAYDEFIDARQKEMGETFLKLIKEI